MYSSVIIKVMANKNSFQTVNDTISAVVKKTGQERGRATLVNNCITDAPSSLAASKSSVGSCNIYDRIKKVANGAFKAL